MSAWTDNIPVVYEHADFLVINKPDGLAVHDDHSSPGAVSVVKQQQATEQLWLCHRLDKDTSGLLILAKSQSAARRFGMLFEQRRIDKYYLAVATRKGKKKQGTIKGSMQKSRSGSWMLQQTAQPTVVTQFFTCGYSSTQHSGLRWVLLKPCTGKTHQLRVAMKSNASPIMGDVRYAGAAADRLYLHAFALRFNYEDKPLEIICPPDQGELFTAQAIPSDWQQPWSLNWPRYQPEQGQ